MARYEINNELNGIEISFDAKPEQDVLLLLKGNGFRWHKVKKLWYAKNSAERLELAKQIADGTADTISVSNVQPAKIKNPVNKHGVKVGDLFSIEWGYDQTNVNFFQVIGLRGESSVLIREVSPSMESEEYYSNGLAADRSYDVPNEILPPSSFSIFVKDQENGDLHRTRDYGNNQACFTIGDIKAIATPYRGEKMYESWYH